MPRAVLFDLDDTLFDHRLCARTALSTLHDRYDCFRSRPFGEIERLHAGFLEQLHLRVLRGELALDRAREERFRRLFEAAGIQPSDALVAEAAAAYRDGYKQVRQPIAGAASLLAAVKERAAVAIVSNNLLEEQEEKLRSCGLDAYVDVLVVSEEAGVSKPDPEIFEITLARLGLPRDDVVMVGDSWAADIIGALAAGIRPIWFNPRGRTAPDPDARVDEIRTLDPPDEALAVIFGADEHPRGVERDGADTTHANRH